MNEQSWAGTAIEAAIPALVAGLSIIGAFTAAIMAMILKGREKERLHKERMLLVEKGAEIPRELLGPAEKKPSDYRTTRVVLLITGAFFIVMSVGVVVGIGIQEGIREAAPGVIAGAIGAGLLVAERMIGRRFGPRAGGTE
ncbi:MAG: hypothetical protein EHM19_12405 [Candidatus Latescibacterota bacterium]|nr:MAG: hypothetical protein EHM19_12405 [Candidatus Latescibacterota bacterium]